MRSSRAFELVRVVGVAVARPEAFELAAGASATSVAVGAQLARAAGASSAQSRVGLVDAVEARHAPDSRMPSRAPWPQPSSPRRGRGPASMRPCGWRSGCATSAPRRPSRPRRAPGRSRRPAVDVIHLEIGEPDFDTPANIARGRQARARRGLDPLRPAARPARAARGDRRGPQRPARRSTVDPANVVVTPGAKPIMYYAITGPRRPGRRGHLPGPGLPDLRVDDPLRRRARRCPSRSARRTTSASTWTSCARWSPTRTRLIIFNRPHNPTGGVLDPRRPRGHRRHRHRARHPGPGRRDLRPHRLRGRARLDRLAARHGRAHDRPRRLLQDVRDDRLAARLRDPAAGAGAGLQPADHQHGLVHVGLLADRRRRGADRPAGRGRRDGRGVPRAAVASSSTA